MSKETEPKENEVLWRRYPHLDSAVETESPAVLKGIERTCRELDRLSRTGTEQERERARAALIAYDRALKLFRQLMNLRDEALRSFSNTRRGVPITK